MRYSIGDMLNRTLISADIVAAIGRKRLTLAQAAERMGFSEGVARNIVNGVGLDRIGLQRALADLNSQGSAS